MTGNRKHVKHYHEPVDLHELTFSRHRRRTLLDDDKARRLLLRGHRGAISGDDFRLVAFVLMPEHVHLLVCSMVPKPEIDRLLFAIKRPFSYRIKKHFEKTGDPHLAERPGAARKNDVSLLGRGRRLRSEHLSGSYDRSLDQLHSPQPGAARIVNGTGLEVVELSVGTESDKQVRIPDLPTIHGLPDFVV